MTGPHRISTLAVLLAAILSGCCDCTDSPAPESTGGATVGEFHPEIGLGRYRLSGSVHRERDESLRVQVQVVDSMGRVVALREGDQLHFRVGASDSVSRTGTISLPKVAVGDSLSVELVLRDSGSVSRTGLRVPSPPVLVPTILPRDTLLEVDFDSSWESVNTLDSIAVVGPIGNVLTGVGRIQVNSGVIGSRPRRSVGGWFMDLRPMVRLAATAGRMDSLYFGVLGGGAQRSFVGPQLRMDANVAWYDDLKGTWRIPLGL